jgi:hypothetical protein
MSLGTMSYFTHSPIKDFYGIFERATKGLERVLILLDAIYYRLEVNVCSLVRI